MIVINKKTVKGLDTSLRLYIVERKKYQNTIIIPRVTAQQLGLFTINGKMTASFLNDEKLWNIYFSTDKDGFELTEARNKTLQLISAPLVRMLNKTFPGIRHFRLFDTKRTAAGVRLYELRPIPGEHIKR